MQKYSVNNQSVGILLSWVKGGEIAIPEIQRPFVWTSRKVRDLMDSLYKGYPVGYIITWKNPDVRSKDGTISSGRKVIIDGQQRITALTAAVAGLSVIDKNYKESRIKISFNPLTEEFATRTPATAKDREWIEDISTILAEDSNLFSSINAYFEKNPEVDREQVQQAFTRLLEIKSKPVGVIELEGDLDIETVTEIFIRINSKGVVLSQADFAMSKIASYGEFGTRLRKLIDYFCHLAEDPKFYKDLTANDKDFASSSYLPKIAWLKNENDSLYDPSYSDLTRVAFMKEFRRGKISDLVSLLSGRNFETRTFEKEIADESFVKLERGILSFVNEYDFKQFVMIVRSTGFISPKMITSKNALNFAYTLYLILREQQLPMNDIQSIVRRWFVASLLTSRYTSSPESSMDADIRAIARRGAQVVLGSIEESQLSDAFWNLGIVQALENTSVRSPILNTFWAAQAKANDKGFLSTDILISSMLEQRGDIHHIFPRDYLKKFGFAQSLTNQIANYTYAETWVNIRIKNKPPQQYFGEILSQVEGGEVLHGGITDRSQLLENLSQNCIPESVFTMNAENYEEFLAERRVMMARKLKNYYQSL